MKRKEADKKYKWDFSHLYKSSDKWKEDLAKVVKMCEKFKEFEGKLNQKSVFFAYLDLDHEIDLVFNKLFQYLHLADIDQTNQEFQELKGLMMNEYQKISIATAFIAPELKAVGEQTVLGWLKEDGKYHKYEYGISRFFDNAKHVLSQHDEELLSKVGRSRGAISGMYDSLAYADRHDVEIDYQGKKQVLSQTLYREIMEDSDPLKDQELRRQASSLFSLNFSNRKHSFAKIYEGIIQASKESINLRHWNSCLEASLNSDKVSVEVYEKLLEIGKKYIKPFQDYELLIKKHFNFTDFYQSDTSLRLVKTFNKTFTVEEAKDLIENALAPLGKEYLHNLKIAWSDNRIDYYEDTNKRDGAYSSGGGGVEPIILMNWDNKVNSVNTLAHESGHSVHTLLADANQPYPLSQYPIILAEVASTVNEHFVFDYMFKNSESKDEKIYLLQQRIADLCGVFYRQIQFAEFEYEVHKLVEASVPLTADSLATLFKDLQLKYGGDIFVQSDKLGYGWPRISHFFHSPFYVYKYAVDVTASIKLYEDVKNGKPEILLNFLKAGGHKPPLEIMKDVGIDFEKEETYLPLINAIEKHVEELTDLLN